jgi:hypothetical protein
MKYDVFISFKNSGKTGQQTPDAAAARKVYAALMGRGIATFFSEESLAEVGKGLFSKAIESALDSARVLILVASCREHIESRWVEAEWGSFLEDVRSGHKEGELFILSCGDLKPADLPMFLRRQQMFREADLEKMLSFVSNAMSAQTTLNDLIEVCLHCFRPENNEDKVYLVTVQEGASAATRNVVAHWGARAAKRLSSQVKAVNVSADLAKAEVEKARQEKVRGGYQPASHVNLLSPEAWLCLSASLGVADAAPRDRSSSSETGGKRAPLSATQGSKKVVATPKKSKVINNSKSGSSLGRKRANTVMEIPEASKIRAPRVKAARPLNKAAPASAKGANSPTNSALSAKKSTRVSSAPAAAKAPPAQAAGTVCISGKLPSGRKKADYAQPLQAVGLRLVDDVVKGLAYVVVADPNVPTSKTDKARKLGVPVLSWKQLEALIAKRGKASRRK